MTAEREVLVDVVARAIDDTLDGAVCQGDTRDHAPSIQHGMGGDKSYDRWVEYAAANTLDALRAHPVELLALLAEPKVCETCGGDGDLRRTDGYPPGLDEVGKPCVTCHGTGSVAVDVLDLLVQAGKAEVLDKTATRVNNNEWRHYTVRHDATVYVAKDGTP